MHTCNNHNVCCDNNENKVNCATLFGKVLLARCSTTLRQQGLKYQNTLCWGLMSQPKQVQKWSEWSGQASLIASNLHDTLICCDCTAAKGPQAQTWQLHNFGNSIASDKLCDTGFRIPACLEPRMHLQETSQCMSLQSSPPEITAAETCWDIRSLLQQWHCLSCT